MDTTTILRREHHLHAQLLDGLEALLERAERSSSVDRDLARRLFAFFERFVDGLHQDKEERALFPRIIARTGRLEIAEVERLDVHHQRDRRLLASLRELIEEPGFTAALDLDAFVHRARVYVAFQRRHMQEEDQRLLPLVRRTLTASDDRAVLAGFRRLEHEHGLSFEPEARKLLNEVTLRLGRVPPSRATRTLAEAATAPVPEVARVSIRRLT